MILALDCSAGRGSVALVRGGETARSEVFSSPRGRGGELFAVLEDVLRGGPEIDLVVVGTGPGGYNGVRSAIATAWGIAAAREVPLAGVSSLLGLADGAFLAAGDARRDQFYFASVAAGAFVAEPKLVRREELVRLAAGGRVIVPEPIDFLPQAEVGHPDAARLARIGAGARTAAGIPEPLYLKPAYITQAARA